MAFRDWEILSWKVGKVAREWYHPEFVSARIRLTENWRRKKSISVALHDLMNVLVEGIRAHAYTIGHLLVAGVLAYSIYKALPLIWS